MSTVASNLSSGWKVLANESRLRVRIATLADCNAIYTWRNHPETRRHFFDPAPISLDAHGRWLAAVLRDPQRYLLIAEDQQDKPVGVMRFDIAAFGDVASIDIYLVPERRGGGMGKSMLLAGLTWLKTNTSVRRLHAEVLSANHSSRRMFEAAGFSLASSSFTLDLERANR